MPPASDWFFGNRKESYARARKNTAAMAAEMRGSSEDDARTTLAALNGDESFLLGKLASGEEVRIAAREVGRHGMVWGSSGAGKSYGLVIITNGWSAGGARRLQLIDPKGETVLMKSLHVAADYLDLPCMERRHGGQVAGDMVDTCWHAQLTRSPAFSSFAFSLSSSLVGAVGDVGNAKRFPSPVGRCEAAFHRTSASIARCSVAA